MHFVESSGFIAFNVTTAVVGIIGAFVVGVAIGYIFAGIWNYLE